MSNQKHTVATDALETLGTIIDEHAGRDAIHLAVEPIEAAEVIGRGMPVQIYDGKAWNTGTLESDNCVGIVDPFLNTHCVKPGQRFWLVVKPRTITSLRHVWTHPAFGDAAVTVSPDKAASEAWLRDFHDRVDCGGATYEQMLDLAVGERVTLHEEYGPSYNDGQWILIRGFDASGSIPAEFWTHVENVTGQKVPGHMRAEYFSCSC